MASDAAHQTLPAAQQLAEEDVVQLITQLEDVFGRSLRVEHRDPRPGDIRHSTADPSRLFELFPDVDPIDFDEGLALTLDWWKTQV